MNAHSKKNFEEHLQNIIDLKKITEQIKIKKQELEDLKLKRRELKTKVLDFEALVLLED